MKLLLKFNLVFILVFALGLVATGYVTWNLLQRNARDETLDRARLLMENALAVRKYTQDRVNPLLQTQMKYTFLSESVPGFSAIEVLDTLRQKYADYGYKEAMLNPTNPRDRAVDWEADIITRFRNASSETELVGDRATPTGAVLYVARPLKVGSPACLQCHSTVDAAPKPLVERFGPANGFGWQFNEIVGAQIVSVPTAVPQARALSAFTAFMQWLTGVIVLIAVALNLMLWLLVIRPVKRLASIAGRVSLGQFEAPEFSVRGRDEMRDLADALTRMRKSLVQAMKMLES
ncbi:MAG TPA: DUF3365 domain-containing protein [Burkholderiaceae bacterium]|nr:DUF3365 domain-containing protein [Burkholderiaceae bacterium]